MMTEYNEASLDTLCAALAAAMAIPAPQYAAPANRDLTDYLRGRTADRVLLYHPDAVAQWVFRKYPQLFREVTELCEKEVPLRSVMPSVTPVCFGTMYTGAQPEVHGIRKYEKPVIRIDTLFDAMIRAGKRCAIVADTQCSMGKIFREREMDYFLYPGIAEINAKAADLIREDRYDYIAVYNGNYDSVMHKTGPESVEALAEARANSETFAMLHAMIRAHWKAHRTLLGFAMDHGCHEIDGACGSHGLDMPEDLNIVHSYVMLES